ncbi:MAG: PAS domain S-box protein, partial [Saprospiraceae bacterium]|nr:PAS domain S-box protein [Saprospiraceae bacterium]
MMEKIQHSGIKIIFLFATIILVTLALQSYVRIKNLITESEIINHTNLVKLNLEKISSHVSEVESNNRAYMLTIDSAFIRSSQVALTNLNDVFSVIDSLTKDNPKQIQNVILLRNKINERIKMMDYNMILFSKNMITVEDRLRAKELMENIKTKIHNMKSEEDRLLDKHGTSVNKLKIIVIFFTIFLIIVAILVLVLSYYKILRELRVGEGMKTEIVSHEIKMQNILKNAPDAIITIDENGIIMSWNPQAENIFEWKEEEVLGKTLTETIIPERYRERHESGLKHLLKTGEGPVLNKEIEVFALKKNLNEFPVELKISAS